MRFVPAFTLLLLPLCSAACTIGRSAPGDADAADTVGALETQRGWWRALATGDTAFLRAHAAPGMSLTLSSGNTLDLTATITQSSVFATSAAPTFGWSEELVRLVAPGTAVARTRATERAGLVSSAYRYVTVLVRNDTAWRVTFAQSTREAEFTPRLPTAAAGAMSDYVGSYRTPGGGILRVVARDSVLALIQPNGREIRLEPIGPSLFEFDYVAPAGVITRFFFSRDASGRVISATRLLPGAVNTFARDP